MAKPREGEELGEKREGIVKHREGRDGDREDPIETWACVLSVCCREFESGRPPPCVGGRRV